MNGSRSRAAVLMVAFLALAVRVEGQELPAGTRLHLRLGQPLSSYGSKAETPVSAILISPFIAEGRTLLPLNTELHGQVVSARRVGLGFSRETAVLHIVFDVIQLPDGEMLPLTARVSKVDDAREIVDEKGQIRGIRATSSLSSTLSGAFVSVGFVDPMLLGFTVMSSLSVFRIPESEIVFPAGTELQLEVLAPIALTKDFGPIAPAFPPAAEPASGLEQVLRALPYRTATADRGVNSDITNLLFLGERAAVERAFDAAGWGRTDELSAESKYQAIRAIVENQGYREAPMSVLLLDGRTPQFTYAKTLNTFFQRHHLRIFGSFGSFDGTEVWTSSSTHDSGIGFSRSAKTLVHVVDENIDEERAKIVHDLVLTGCVSGLATVDRPWLADRLSNSTGDTLITDKKIAVLRLNECVAPLRADADLSARGPVNTPQLSTRVVRNIALTFKNDLFRGNLVYQGYSVLKTVFSKKPKTAERSIHYAGEEFRIVQGASVSEQTLDDQPTFHPAGTPPPPPGFATKLQFTLNSGYSRFGNSQFSTQNLSFLVNVPDQTVEVPFSIPTELRSGWTFSPKVTVNAHPHVSHEFSYSLSQTTFAATFVSPLALVQPENITAPANIRQFGYNLKLHARRNGARVRPFAVVGGGAKLIRLYDAAAGRRRIFRYAFKEVGVIQGAWDFGSKPPLEGGGIFEGFFQYGGGVDIHLTRHYLIRADFRESLSPQPDFWTKSYPTLTNTTDGLQVVAGELVTHGPLRHQQFTVGFGVAF